MSKLAEALNRKAQLEGEIAQLTNQSNSIKVNSLDFQSKTAMEKMEMELMKANPLFQKMCEDIVTKKAELSGITSKLSVYQSVINAGLLDAQGAVDLENQLF